jgi:Flp pilus assembly protein TadB
LGSLYLISSFVLIFKYRREKLLTRIKRSYGFNFYEKISKSDSSGLWHKISRWLEKNGVKLDHWNFIAIVVIFLSVFFLGCLFLVRGILIFFGFSSIFLFLLYLFIDTGGRKKSAAKELQMEGFLTELTGNLYSNPNLLMAIKKTLSDLEEPLKKDIEDIIADCSKGSNLTEALENFMKKNRSKLIQIIVTGLIAANEKGGDLINFLNDQLDYLRKSRSLNSYIRILSAGPRYTAYIIAILPIAVIFAAMMLNRNFAVLLFSDTGVYVLIYVFVSYSIGFFLINKITNINDQTDRNIN